MTDESLLNALRQATEPQHQALEQHSFAEALLKGTATRQQIMSHTRAEWCFYRTVEPWLLDCNNTLHTAWRRLLTICKPRASLLQADDEAYHQHPEPLLQEPQDHALALASRLQQLVEQDDAARLGILYVTEGSHLGGQVIASHLRRSYPQDQDALTRYSLYPHIAQHWRNFCERLNALSLLPPQRQHMLESAIACFEGFDAIIHSLSTD